MRKLKGGVERTPSQRGRAARRKGRKHEQETARAFRPAYPNAKRGLQQTRASGDAPDVVHTPFWVEAKRQGNVSILSAYKQATVARAECTDPVYKNLPILIVSREDGQAEDLVTLDLHHFVSLMKELEALRKTCDERIGG